MKIEQVQVFTSDSDGHATVYGEVDYCRYDDHQLMIGDKYCCEHVYVMHFVTHFRIITTKDDEPEEDSGYFPTGFKIP